MSNYFFTAFQILNFLILFAWLVLVILALVKIRQRGLSGNMQIAWVLIVLLIPILGALAFLIVSPE